MNGRNSDFADVHTFCADLIFQGGSRGDVIWLAAVIEDYYYEIL